ncbi:unnamed protein product [Cunninghamella blakesleeana]
MDLNWRREHVPKSELSSTAWQNPQSFIAEQDLVYRKEMEKRTHLLNESVNGESNNKLDSHLNNQQSSLQKDLIHENASNNSNHKYKLLNSHSDNPSKNAHENLNCKKDDSNTNNYNLNNNSNKKNSNNYSYSYNNNNHYGDRNTGAVNNFNQTHPPYHHSGKQKHQNNRHHQQHHQQHHQRKNIHPDDHYSRGSRLHFRPFMNRYHAIQKVEHGEFYSGQLRINYKNRMEAYVTSEELDDDIFIYGMDTRNRALDGDTVIVQLVDLEEVLEKKNKDKQFHRKLQEKINQQPSSSSSSSNKNEKDDDADDECNKKQMGDESNDTYKNNGNEDDNDNVNNKDDECDGNVTTIASLVEDDSINIKDNDLITKEDGEESNSLKQRYAGKVVYILSRQQDSFTGLLYIDFPLKSPSTTTSTTTISEKINDENKKIIWFKPNDVRVPFMRIEINHAPMDILDNSDFYKSQLVEVVFLRWPITSKFPYGEVIKHIGPIGSIITEEIAILSDNSIRDRPFDNLVEQTVNEIPKSISSFEYKCRRDLRDEIVFTIDPSAAKDLDDALHIKREDDGTFEVGVHIADVSYYVKKHTPLDTEAKKRGTTTYLVGRSVPMLPTLLCEKVCSLTPLTDKLTFSVIWKMDKDGNVINTWFGRTVIRSCAKLSYENAQSVIDGGHIPESIIVYNIKKSDLETRVLDLYHLSVKMRQKRFENGALSMNSVKLQFTLDEFNEPDELSVFVSKEANKLVEEFMILANISVAQKIGKAYPQTALLRRHESPIERRLEGFLNTTLELGYDFDGSTAGTLQSSFDKLDDEDVKSVLLTMAIQPMKRAKYFSAGSIKEKKYLHYALNSKYYTHFTSPIRRYADIIVHRQLSACLSEQNDCGYTKNSILSIVTSCNQGKDNAKNAQDADIILHLVNYLEKLAKKNDGALVEEAIVINTNKKAFDIYVPKYGLEYHVLLNNLPLQQSYYDDGRLILQWEKGITATHERAMENYLSKKNNYYNNSNNHKNTNNEDGDDDDINQCDNSEKKNNDQCKDSENDDDNSNEHDVSTKDNNNEGDDEQEEENDNTEMKELIYELSLLKVIEESESSFNSPRRIRPSILNTDKSTQIIGILTKMNVNLYPVTSRSPNQIHIYPINPF